ncbi:MAG: Sapep family Mn(2+)-dependent dipeptidase [Clostridia bacterium]|nr:Sapep family Mn(2+)-dependent dipeptidase [Clostridia bacterium]
MNKEIFKNFYNSLSRLISCPSVEGKPQKNAPFGKGVRDALDVTLDIAKSLGYSTIDHDGYCGVAEVGEGEPFAILGHVDVVPISGEWYTPPFTLTTLDDVMYGRGVSDDKGPLLACMYATRQLLDEGYIPSRRIRFIIGCNEESGWKCIDHFNEVDSMPLEGFTPDGSFPVVYCEKGICQLTLHFPAPVGISHVDGGKRANMVADECVCTLSRPSAYGSIEGVEISSNRLTLSARGKSSHGAHPELGDNAIVKMLGALSKLYPDYYLPIYNALKDIYASGIGLAGEDDSGKCTLCVGQISLSNTLDITIDIRYPAITYTIGKCIDTLRDTFGVDVVGEYRDQPPLYVPKDTPLVKSLLQAYNKVTGLNAKPIAIGGGTYARALERGVAFGGEFSDYDTHMHEPNERMPISVLEKMYDIYYEGIKNTCFYPLD